MLNPSNASPSTPNDCGLTTPADGGITLFESLIARTGPWQARFQSNSLHVYAGADPRPVPAMMGPGIDSLIRERWESLWQWLCREKKTREDQTKRLQDLEQALRDKRELVGSNQEAKQKLDIRIQGLRQACISPFLFHPQRRLFACRSDWGLVFVFAFPMRLKLVLADSHRELAPISFRPLGVATTCCDPDEIHDFYVSSRACMPKEQIHTWAEAAAFYGLLYELKDPGDPPDRP